MAFKLSQHWKDKIRTRAMINRGISDQVKGQYRVKWDRPDWDKGEKVQEKTFADLPLQSGFS